MAIRLDIIVDDKGSATVKRVLGDVKKELKDVEKQSTSTSTSLSQGFSKAQFAIAGFLAATAGITAAIKSTIDYADSMNDLSRATGISVETLTALDFAAKQSGTTIQAVSSAMRILAQNVQNAKKGNSEMADTFRKLGIDVNKAGQTLESTFFDVLDAVQGKEDRVAISTDLLGRGALELGSMAQEGSAGVRSLMQQAERLGGVISTEQARQADEFADAIGRFNLSLQGLKNQAVLPILEPLGKFIDSLTNTLPKVIAYGDALNAIIMAVGHLTMPQELAKDYEKFAAALDKIKAIDMKNFVAGLKLEGVAPAMKLTTEQAKQLGEALDNALKPLKELSKSPINFPKAKGDEDTLGIRGTFETAEKLKTTLDFIPPTIGQMNDLWAEDAQYISDAEQRAQGLTSNIAGAMASAIMNINSKTKVLQSLMAAVGRTILSEIVSAITQAIAKAIFFKAIMGFLNPTSLIGGASISPGGGGFAAGGGVIGYPGGGIIGGGVPIRTRTGDNRLIAAQTGEGVLTRNTVNRLGGAAGVRALNEGGGSGVNINFSEGSFRFDSFDESFMRRKLMPMMNELVQFANVNLAASRVK